MDFYTSDTHFGHTNIIKYCKRPFSSLEEMNETLIANWNNRVGPGDTVKHGGDFALGGKEQIREILERLNGYKILVLGNHDRSATAMKELGFDEVHKYHAGQLGADGAHHCDSFYLTHVPLYDPVPLVHVKLCGHVHEKWKTHWDHDGTLIINIGVDAWDMAPVSAEELRKTMRDMKQWTS